MIDSSIPHREILWNVSSLGNVIAMYALLFVALAICANGFWQRAKLWSAGAPEPSRLRGWTKRARLLWQYAFRQRGTNREKKPKVFHSLIVYGFMVLLFTTTMVFIDHDLGIRIYNGDFYLVVTLLSDLFGLGLLLGVLLAYRRRYIEKPDQLHSTPSDYFLLATLALLCIQGFFLEGLRIQATNDPWALYSPVGYLFGLFFWGVEEAGLRAIHFGMWWFHTLTVYGFIAFIPYTKFFHIFASSANLYFQEIDRPKGAMKFPGNIETLMEQALESESGDFVIGAPTIKELTWKERLDLDACTSCGRCQDACPAYNSGKVLSPKWLILDARNHMLHLSAGESSQPHRSLGEKLDAYLLKTFLLSSTPAQELPEGIRSPSLEIRGANTLVQQAAKSVGLLKEAKLGGEVMDEDVYWSCVTCRACVEACPVGIEHVDHIFDVRRSLTLMEGSIPTEAQGSLRAIENRGNPFGPADDRFNWAAGLEVPLVKSGDEVEVLYWVGCVSAYDTRKQAIARSMVRILNASGVKWGVLGNRESCSGDPARRLGEENLYQSQARKNIEALGSIRMKTIVANCPHCFNTIRNEYPQVDENFAKSQVEVIHHSHFIKRLMERGALRLTKNVEAEVTFHDPCYLGRYNDTYEEPRDVLVQIGGVRLHEMSASKNKGMCCGAGGGHFWMDLKVGERINVKRVNQAAETPAQEVATGCPFCMQMIDDGIKLTNRESDLKVRDIAEFVAEALEEAI